jgi:RNase P/RNase MRP subunit p29
MARPGDLVACPTCGREVAVKRAALATTATIEGHRDPRTNQPCAGAGQDAKELTATRRFDAAGDAQTMSSVTVYGGGRVMVEVNTRSASVDSVIGVLDGVYQTSPPRSGGDFVQRFYVDGPGATASNVVRELRNYGIDAAEGRGGDVPLSVSFTAGGSELRPGDTVVTNGFVGGKWNRRATTMAKAVPFPRPLTTDQEIFDVLAALRAVGIRATSSAEATRAVVVPDADEARAREIVAQHFGAAPTTMAGDGGGGTVHAPKYKVGDQVWASGEDNPLTVLEVIAEGETGSMRSGQWVKDWLYRVRSAKGHEFRVWLSRFGRRQKMARDIRGTPVGQGDKIRVVRSDNPKLVGLEGTVTFEDGGYLTVATTRNGLMAAFDVAASNVEKVNGGPTIHSAQTMALVDVRTLPAGRRIRIPQFGSDKVYVTRGNGWYGGEGGYDGGPWHASYDQPPVMVEDLGPAAPGTFGRRGARTTMATPGEDYAKFRDICRRHNATDVNQILVRGFWARFRSVADATAAASEVRAAGMPVFFNPSKPEIATNSSIGGCNSTSPPTLHAQATSGVVVHAATGISGQVLRRYAVGPAPWLLVRTPHGVVSWPADEARAAAAAA